MFKCVLLPFFRAQSDENESPKGQRKRPSPQATERGGKGLGLLQTKSRYIFSYKDTA